ncbi:MAG: type II secretion system protein GspE, partial [Halieaceae bacterium]|nr:type II secretion system protein GspE [Halieaceae bacterium]
MVETATVPEVIQGGGSQSLNLPFAYAKLNNVLVDRDGAGPVVVHQGDPGIQVLTELRRFLGGPFRLQQVAEVDFKRRLSLAYQRDNNEAVQMAEDISA